MATVITSDARTIKEKVFTGELAGSFDDVVAQLWSGRKGASPGFAAVAMVTQPLLGGLPHEQKRVLEDAVGDSRYFTTARATALNVLLNMILYPGIIAAIAALAMRRAEFTQQLNGCIAVGIGLALLETVLRLRERVLGASGQPVYRGASYAPLLGAALAPLLRGLTPAAQYGTIAVDGFHGDGFEDKLERERRYGEVYSFREQGNGYMLRVEFPRRVPESALKHQLGIPDEMPDYDYSLSVRDGHFVVRGSVVDKNLRKLAAFSPAFPPDFTTNVALPSPVKGFKHRVRNKTLDVVLLKR
jgi:hypothetical protein